MIEINNLTKVLINKKFFEKIVQIIFKKEKKRINISIAFVGQEEIRRLNKKYRKKDRVTDVLSFGRVKEFKRGDNSEIEEIAICPSVVRENAKKYKSTFKKELARVLIHGVLHLLGYDHEKGGKMKKKMEKKEDYYISKIL